MFNYLSCYVPYHHEVVNNHEQFNQFFHAAPVDNLHFEPPVLSFIRHYLAPKGKAIGSGYPSMESLLNKLAPPLECIESWKIWRGKVKVFGRIIVLNKPRKAQQPFHYAFFQSFQKYKDEIVWSFKHILCLNQSYIYHPDWGVDITDEYYKYWESQSFTQLDEIEYADLFCSSDAITIADRF